MAIDPERVVFDAEPLVAHATDEPGAETVARYLRAIQANECEGYRSVVNSPSFTPSSVGRAIRNGPTSPSRGSKPAV